MDSRDSDMPTTTQIIPSSTTAGAVYHQTQKHLWDRVVKKPYPEPTSVIDTPNVSNKDQTHMYAWQKPYMLHAPAATPPNLVAHQCITPSEESHTSAKPPAANTQCNQSAVQSSTEPKIPAPPSVPAAKVHANSASHTV